MARSKRHKCKKCGVYLDITAKYDVDEDDEFGEERIYFEVSCPQCGDIRVGKADPFGKVEAIARKVGTWYGKGNII